VLDHNLIEGLVLLNMCLKTIKLFIMILTLSFILFVAFKITVDIEKDIYGGANEYLIGDCSDSALQDYFELCYDLDSKTVYE